MNEIIVEPIIGMRVQHKILGCGTVKNVIGNGLITIVFDQEFTGKTKRDFNISAFINGTINEINHISSIGSVDKGNKNDKKVHLNAKQKSIIDAAIYRFRVQNLENELPAPKLNDNDLSLALLWDERLRGKKVDKTVLENKFCNDPNLMRLLSARAAEKAAIIFYRYIYGIKVKDISITQILNTAADGYWRYYDILIDGRYPVDVKNSRRARNSNNRYVEHCVPSFKHDYRTKQDVTICGVLSHYLWLPSIIDPYREEESFAYAPWNSPKKHLKTSIVILGETTLEKQQAIKNKFEDPRLLLINFKRENMNFYPPWIFDYPDIVYQERNRIFGDLKGLVDSDFLPKEFLETELMPIFISCGVDVVKILGEKTFLEWELEVIRELQDLIGHGYLSLPFIFFALLKHFLHMLTQPQPNFNPAKYGKFIFFGNNTGKPLGVYDPLGTINSLIRALIVLWKADHKLVRSFRLFKLVNYNILYGKSCIDNKWKTMIAYCGGWTKKGKCGKTPLVLGEHQHCTSCGKLICSECNFCSNFCRADHQNNQVGR